MNYLAHLYLSGDSDKVMLGNFIADFLKGIDASSYDEDIYRGIQLHREIDFFTDRHYHVMKSKKRLWQRHRHYSSVIVDIFYDHFLARNWHEYSEMELDDFAVHTYATLHRFNTLLPKRAKFILPLMSSHNWLVQYAELKGISRALSGIANRTTFNSNMAYAIDDLRKDYDAYENEFRLFFPDLIRRSEAFLSCDRK